MIQLNIIAPDGQIKIIQLTDKRTVIKKSQNKELRYEMVDSNTQAPPNDLREKRIGRNLILDSESKNIHVELEDYYPNSIESQSGLIPDNELAPSAEASRDAGFLDPSSTTAPKTTEALASSEAAPPLPIMQFGTLGVILGGAGLALALGAKGGGGGHSDVIQTNTHPTGTLAIIGAATQGQTLTATNTLADTDGLGPITYTWKDNTGATLGTGATLTLTEAQVGKSVTVTATYTDGHGTAETVTSAATPTVSNLNDTPTGMLAIAGAPVVGLSLSATNTLADADGITTFSYQWNADGVPISGATTSTYTPGVGDLGKAITVTASYIDGHGTLESVTSAATATIAKPSANSAPTGDVTITGTTTEGQTLTASNTLIDIDGLGPISYQWYSNAAAITGATGNTLTLAEAQVGKVITVSASYTDGHGTAESVTSAATAAVANVNDLPSGSVTIDDVTPTQGQVLTAANSLSDPDGNGTVAYRWYAEGVLIAGTSGNTLTLAEAQVGKVITVSASYTDGHGTAESVTSAATAAVANVNDLPSGSVTIGGSATQGQTLTASNNLADADGLGAITYTWKDNTGTILGTGSSFILGAPQVGKTITLTANYTDGHGTVESVISGTSGTVVGVTGPTLVSAFPSDDLTNVLANENLVLIFNEDVSAGVGNIKIVNTATGAINTIAITDAAQVHISGKSVTINPSSDLTANANYYVLVDATAIKNAAGNTSYAGISNTTTLNFSTVPVTTSYIDQGDSSVLIGSEDSSDTKWGGALGQGVTLSYSFATSTTTNSYESGSKTVTSVLNDTQKDSFRTALQRWSEVANLDFVEVPDTGVGTGGIIRAAFANIGTDHGVAYYPTTSFEGADVWLGESHKNTYFTTSPTEPLGGMPTMIHELGHGFALAHPNDNGYDPGFNKLETIMSYNTQDHSYVYLLGGTTYQIYDRTPMILDIAAMQTLYGANMSYNSTDTVYTFAHNDPFFMTIWDGGGNDTISIANLSKDSIVDLREGMYSSIRMDILNVDTYYASESDFYDGTNNLGIAYGAVIENAIGGSGNDTLIGNNGNNVLTGNNGNDVLEGGLGNDTLDGGTGIDMASYQHATTGVVMALHGDGLYNTVYGNDTFTSIEGLMGSDFNDILTGDNADNLIDGGLGDDTLDGGAGNDTVSYLFAKAGVTINLGTTGAQNTISAGSDTLSNFENITGSAYNDTLTGDTGNNVLTGGIGDDTLNGDAGNDTLVGGIGNDILSGGMGNDTLMGDIGDDSLTGGTGTDIFKFANPDSSRIGGLGKDTITDFTSNFDSVLDAGEDIIDLSGFFSQKGITVDASNVTHYIHMSTGTLGLMKIDTSAAGASGTAADSFFTLSGTSDVFADANLASLLAAGQVVV